MWDYNRIYMNSFVGYESLLLSEIADGTVRQTIQIYDKIEKDDDNIGKLKCTLSFKCVLEEIWDFYLTFRDWKTTNLKFK